MSHFSYAPFFQGRRFLQKCWNRTFSMIIYLLTFYLFDEIEKYRNHSCEAFCYVKRNFDKNRTCNLNVYIFYLRFALGIIDGDRCDGKHQKELFYLTKTPFLVVEFSNTVSFWRYVRFDVILTSVTIIKQVFLRKLFCYESLVDIDVSKP